MAAAGRFLFAAFAVLILSPHPARPLPLKLKASTISAAPAALPSVPMIPAPAPAPALAPDIMPAFPTPSGASRPASSLPTIPSSPSPPNPDDELQPNSVVAPSGSASLTSPAVARSAAGAGVAFACGLVVVLLEFVGN